MDKKKKITVKTPSGGMRIDHAAALKLAYFASHVTYISGGIEVEGIRLRGRVDDRISDGIIEITICGDMLPDWIDETVKTVGWRIRDDEPGGARMTRSRVSRPIAIEIIEDYQTGGVVEGGYPFPGHPCRVLDHPASPWREQDHPFPPPLMGGAKAQGKSWDELDPPEDGPVWEEDPKVDDEETKPECSHDPREATIAFTSPEQVRRMLGLEPKQEREYHSGESFVKRINAIMDERGGDYATPDDNHSLTAAMFDLWLKARIRHIDARAPFTAEDVCVFNIIQKLSRMSYGSHDDSWLDIVGYAENVPQLRDENRNWRPKD